MSLLRQSVAALLAAIVASTPAQSPTQSPTPTPESQSQAQAPTPSPLDTTEDCVTTPLSDKPQAYFPSYLHDAFPQLKAAVPALRNLKFEDHPVTGADDAEPILNQAAEALGAMVPRVPNLIAKEELSQVDIPLPYTTSGIPQIAGGPGGRRSSIPTPTASASATSVTSGEEINSILASKLDQPQQRNIFSYRIRSTDDPTLGPILEEFRVNAKDKAVDRNDFSAGNPRSVGYGSTWLMFIPSNLKQSHFRYLGRQKIGKHDTMVVAFAQDPDVATMMAAVGIGSHSCRYLVQGVLWIDESLFDIVRLQTDLLLPLTQLQLHQLRSELQFAEVKIPARNLTLFMPSDVRISWQGKDSAGMELHRYSNYRLFAATSRIIIPGESDEGPPAPPPPQ